MKRHLATAALSLLGGVGAVGLGGAVGAMGAVGAGSVPATTDWPGAAPMRPADTTGALGGNLSGLAIETTRGLWAVRDSGSLLHLERSANGTWKPSPITTAERNLRYPDGRGSPDAEAVTTVADDDTAVYIAAERNGDASNVSRNSILRFDLSGEGSLTASREWKLEPILGATPANTGVEALTWIPDSVLVTMGFRGDSGKPYAPADYPDHGTGLFVTAVESKGELIVLALQGDGHVYQIARIATGLEGTMDVSWSTTRQELWAICDNKCNGQTAVLRPANGTFAVTAIVRPPTGMAALNNEGFAILPTCTNGATVAIWSDDSATAGTALREAALPCGTETSPPATPMTSTAGDIRSSAVQATGTTVVKPTATPTPTPATFAATSVPVTRPAGASDSSTPTRTPTLLGFGALIVAATVALGSRITRRRRSNHD